MLLLGASKRFGTDGKRYCAALKALLKEEEFVYIAACNDEGKPSLTAMLSDVLVARGYNSSTLIA